MKIIPMRLADGQQTPAPDSRLHGALLKVTAVLPVLLQEAKQEVPKQISSKGKDSCISSALSFSSQTALKPPQYSYHFRN